MLNVSGFNRSANKIFFNAWIGLMRLTCLLFLINQSQSLGANFTFYCVAVICLIKPILSNIEKFRVASNKNRKLYSWLFIVCITIITAHIWGQFSNTENADQIAFKYTYVAVETTVIFIATHSLLLIADLFKMRRERKLNKVNGKSDQSF